MTSMNAPIHRPLSCCMIVRDNGPTIVPCLESIRPWVDDLVVVDTGSIDDTPQIARRFGARLFHFPWIDDFSAARNESLRHALGEWLFWMDSDDTISPENGRKLRDLATGFHLPNTAGYIMQVHCPAGNGAPAGDLTVVDHVKLFRNHPLIRFEGRIHEQVLLPIRRLGGNVLWTDIFVLHSGADHTPGGRIKKFERDLRILHLDLAERPGHPFVLFNLGMTYSELGEHAQVVDFLMRCLEGSDPGDSQVRKAYALLINSLSQLGRIQEAESACRRARELYPRDAELCFREGLLARQTRRLKEAERAFRSALRQDDERHLSSIDRGIAGFKTRHNLALVYADMGRADLAEIQWRLALEEVPDYAKGRQVLVETLLKQGKLSTAEVELEHTRDSESFRCERLLLEAELAERRGDVASARRFLATAVQDYPHELDPLHRLCEFLFAQGEEEETVQAFRQLLQKQPNSGAIHHNLGNILHRFRRFAEAEEEFRESLQFRPGSGATHLLLAQVLLAQGKRETAIISLQDAQKYTPGDSEISILLEQLNCT